MITKLLLLAALIGGPVVPTPPGPLPAPPDARDHARAYTHRVVSSRGFSRREWVCLDTLIRRESNWSPTAKTGSHYGLGQVRNMKPGTPLKRQVERILKYLNHRYQGSACKALKHSYRTGWY